MSAVTRVILLAPITPEAAKVLKKMGVERRAFLSESIAADHTGSWREIYTAQGTILCELDYSQPRFAAVDAGPSEGNNETGHKLPTSGGWKC